jgi:hypothetical protein
MGFDDGATNPKSHAGSMIFGTEEGIEDPVWTFERTDAGIADSH